MHTVHHAGDHTKVMGDQQQCHSQFPTQAQQQPQNLRLHRHIQRRGRFIGNQQVRLARHGNGDQDTLSHAARKLMGIVIRATRCVTNADQVQQFNRPPSGLDGRCPGVPAHDVFNLRAYRQHRVQRRHGVLKHHGNASPADILHHLLFDLQQVLAHKQHRAAPGNRRTLWCQAHQRPCSHAFAAA